MFKILQVKNFPIWDIFKDEGWYQWSRYLLKSNKLIYIAGNKLTNKQTLSSLVLSIKDLKKPTNHHDEQI